MFKYMTDLSRHAKEINEANRIWWYTEDGTKLERSKKLLLMLIISEIAEAMEGHRKDLMDDHLPHRKMIEVELADAYIRLMDYAGGMGLDLDECRVTSTGEEGNYPVPELLFDICDWTSDLADYNSPFGLPEEIFTTVLDIINALCVHQGYDLDGAIDEKRAYNAKRADHSYAARKAANGKKY